MSTFGDIKVSTINGGSIGAKNAIINGNFGINQRGVSGTVTLAAGNYGHDRWKAGASGCTYTFATSENVTTLTITAGSLIQVVEDINLLTDTYTLSWTGTAQGKIGAGAFGASGITGSVTGGSSLNIEINTGTISKVQLERGSVATPFDFRSIGQELALCQRYYEKSFELGTAPAQNVGSYNGTSVASSPGQLSGMSFGDTRFKVNKRAAPTIVFYNPAAANAFARDQNAGVDCSATAAWMIGESSFAISATTGSGSTATHRIGVHWAASSEI